MRRQANREKATILWGGECGFRSDHQTGTSCSKRGKTPVIPSTGERFRCNMVSAIDNSGHLYFKMFDGSFTVPVFLDFLQRLVNQSKRKVFLVVDNLSVHKSQAVSEWVKEHSTRIRLFFLPKYSPDLNPDEYLNNDVKSNAVGRRRAKSKEEMKKHISSYLWSTQKQPKVVKSSFQAKSVKYAEV